MNVVTRIAPSPTGQMHIGTVRTALFNYLFAKHHGGTYFVRIEDTDKERNKPEWTQAIWDDFAWCGLIPDKRYIQSKHIERHKELLHSLVEKGSAYVSKEPSHDDPSKTVDVVRLKNPGARVTFNDLVRGEVSFDTAELGDFVIARSVDDPLYHFAVVADDADAGVTHVIRAEEHISNTPRQILIIEALGFLRPLYAHIPLILAPDKSKLSKRKHGASVDNYRAQGYLPEAIINYLAFLGWNPGTEEELFTLEQLVERFSLDQVQKSGAVFDETKMKWFNREYLLKMESGKFKEEVKKFSSILEQVPALLPIIRDRISTFGEVSEMEREGEFAYFMKAPSYDAKDLVWKKDPAPEGVKARLEEIKKLLQGIAEADWSTDTIKAAVWPYAEKEGRGGVLWPLRYALTGRDKSPDPFTVAGILGRDETLLRIDNALRLLGA
jgi:glutamyl-tRNA synthetase